MGSSAVAACVRLLSQTIAALPLHVYRDQNKSKTVETHHPVYDLIHSKPNAFQTSFTWIQQAITHCLLHGNFYALVGRNVAGDPVGLWPLNPYGMVVEAVDGELRYRYAYGGQRDEFASSDILHFKGPSLNGLVGLSIVHMARQGIGISVAQEAHAASLFRNNARPGLVIQFPGFLSVEQRAVAEQSFSEKFTGALNSGRTMLLEGDMKVTPVGFSSEDAQFLESRQFSRHRDCALVPWPTRKACPTSPERRCSTGPRTWFHTKGVPMHLYSQQLELRSLAEDGSFEGIAAAYGNVDSQGDRIEPGASSRRRASRSRFSSPTRQITPSASPRSRRRLRASWSRASCYSTR